MGRRTADRAIVLIPLLLLAAAVGFGGAKEIRLELQVEPELELDGTEKIYVGPVLLEPRTQAASSVDLFAVREFERFVRSILRRQTRLNLVPPVDDLSAPSDDPDELAETAGFWRLLGEETGADYIMSASIDVTVLDRAGYTTEEFVSPEDGQTYFRQVLVEETGFDFDILLLVVDGHTGQVVHREQISDFKQRNERKLREIKDMFQDLYTLENRLLGIFVPRTVQAKRILLTG